jgi:LacI family transcriptional regulator
LEKRLRRKVRAVDVAAAAGVSSATVDRVLNGRGGVSPDKERRVLECAQRLGLDRNFNARPLRIIRCGVLMQPVTNPFYARLSAGFAAANRRFAAANLQAAVYTYDISRPDEGAALALKLGETCDALIVVSAEHAQISDALQHVSAYKPVIALVSELPISGRLAYVGIDNRAAGRLAGDLMGRFLGPAGGDVVVVSGWHAFVALGEREMGFRATLAERHPACRLLSVIETSEQVEKVDELVRETLLKHPSVRGLYNVSAGNRRIAAVLRQLGREDIVVITHELTNERCSLLREGLVDVIIDQNPELEAMAAMNILGRHFGRLVEDPLGPLTPFTVHFRENC